MIVVVQSRAGTFSVEVSGTQENPIVCTTEPFMAGGIRKVDGDAVVSDGSVRKAQPGLYFRSGDVYIQCPDAVKEIQAAIAELPHKVYWARKVKEVLNADGDKIEVEKWHFDCGCWTERGTFISETAMGWFLDAKGITEIEIVDAVKMWADEKEDAHIKANEEGNKHAEAIFQDDEADQGYEQACENAGIPRFLR